MAPRRQTPLFVLTGFLGSGKTSLLRGWLGEPAFANTLVLVNEIGEVGVDQQVLAPVAGDALLLESGCVCCDAGGDLVAMLEQLFFDRLHRRIQAFDRVVIETTGLALPSAALTLLGQSDLIRERYARPFVIATLDAMDGAEQWGRHPEVRDQIASAQAIVLTKTDLASDAQIEAARARLTTRPADLPVLTSGREPVPAALVLGLAAGSHPGDWSDGAGPGPAAHTPNVTTAFAPLPDALSESALVAGVQALFAGAGPALLRVKGYVSLSEAGPHLLQADVARVRLEPVAAAPAVFGLTIIAAEKPAADLAAMLATKLRVRELRW